MPWVERPGVRLFYEAQGPLSPVPITLLNGYSRSSRDFQAMARFLETQGIGSLRIDNRGSGQTQESGPFTLDEMVEDVVAVWDTLKIPRSHVLGISFGGVLAMLLAARFRTRVQSLCLVSTTPTSKYLGLDNDLGAQPPQAAQERLKRYFSPGFQQKSPLMFRSMLKETAKAFHDPGLRQRAQLQRDALREFDYVPELSAVQAPTLILHGTQDAVALPDAASLSAKHIPRSQLEWFEGAGHLLLVEAPKRLYDTVRLFLRPGPNQKTE